MSRRFHSAPEFVWHVVESSIICREHACSAHFCHPNHFCHSSPVLSIHINRFCQPHHFCQLLSPHSSPVLSTISTTYVATDEVTTFVKKAGPLLSTLIVLPLIIIIITRCSMRETREKALLHAWVQRPIRPHNHHQLRQFIACIFIHSTNRKSRETNRKSLKTNRKSRETNQKSPQINQKSR